MHDLAGEALPRRKVHVGLDPHPTDGNPLPGGNLLTDFREQVGVAFFYPGVLLSLRATEAVGRVVVHQRDGRGKRAGALSNRLLNRPQPRRVDVRVPGGNDAMTPDRAIGRRKVRSKGASCGLDIGDRVERRHDCLSEFDASRVTDCECAHHSGEHVKVVGERLGLDVDEDEVGSAEPIGRLL